MTDPQPLPTANALTAHLPLEPVPNHGAWGRWGEMDEAGALNRVGPAEVLRGTALVRDGVILRLSQNLGPDTAMSPHRKKPERFMTRDGGDYLAGARRPGGFQFVEDVVSFSTHSGTHVDALSHAFYDDQLYNGYPAASVRSTTGAGRCGAEKLLPVVTRGVLLDLSDGPAAAGRAFGAEELQRAADAAEVNLEPGDVVLLHTGWLAAAGGDPASYFSCEPGINESGARWLTDAAVAMVGADNYAVEVQPSAPETAFPVHQMLIRDEGIPLIENVVLDKLVATARSTFLFVASPLPLVGGTAAPVSPVAVL